jgi:hypothetical protein
VLLRQWQAASLLRKQGRKKKESVLFYFDFVKKTG